MAVEGQPGRDKAGKDHQAGHQRRGQELLLPLGEGEDTQPQQGGDPQAQDQEHGAENGGQAQGSQVAFLVRPREEGQVSPEDQHRRHQAAAHEDRRREAIGRQQGAEQGCERPGQDGAALPADPAAEGFPPLQLRQLLIAAGQLPGQVRFAVLRRQVQQGGDRHPQDRRQVPELLRVRDGEAVLPLGDRLPYHMHPLRQLLLAERPGLSEAPDIFAEHAVIIPFQMAP